MGINIKFAVTKKEIEECLLIRRKVFIEEQGIPEKIATFSKPIGMDSYAGYKLLRDSIQEEMLERSDITFDKNIQHVSGTFL